MRNSLSLARIEKERRFVENRQMLSYEGSPTTDNFGMLIRLIAMCLRGFMSSTIVTPQRAVIVFEKWKTRLTVSTLLLLTIWVAEAVPTKEYGMVTGTIL